MTNFGVKYRELSKLDLNDLTNTLYAQQGLVATKGVYKTLTAAQILGTDTNPITIISAPGTGFYNFISGVSIEYIFNTTQFAPTGNYGFFFGSSSIDAFFSNSLVNSLLTSTQDSVYATTSNSTFQNSNFANIINQPITFSNVSGAGSQGDGSVNMYLEYKIYSVKI